MSPALAWGLGLALAGAVIVLVTGQGTRAGAAAGLAAAVAMVIGFGPAILAPLATFVLGAGALTRLGRAAKERARSAEPNRGRRGAAHVAAKLGIPAALALAAAARPELRDLASAGAMAALAGAFADTAGTEAGPLRKGSVFRFQGRRIRRAAHGEPGGVSALGLLAAALAALAVVLAGRFAGVRAPGSDALLFGAGFGAALLESAAAGTLRGVGHFGRNAGLSAVAAASAMLFLSLR